MMNEECRSCDCPCPQVPTSDGEDWPEPRGFLIWRSFASAEGIRIGKLLGYVGSDM